LIGKQKVVLFSTFRENGWEEKGREAARNALSLRTCFGQPSWQGVTLEKIRSSSLGSL
jgi:hypothetical protein